MIRNRPPYKREKKKRICRICGREYLETTKYCPECLAFLDKQKKRPAGTL